MNTLAPSFFNSIILILAVNEDMHKSSDEFKFRPDTTTNFRVIGPCASEKKKDVYCCERSSAIIFDRIFFIFAGNKDNHKVLDEFEI